MGNHCIAIDGPAGAGKSTLAQALARELGFLYVDTGAIYRTVGVYAKSCGFSVEHAEEVVPVLSEIRIGISRGDDGEQRMFLNGEDVTAAIRQNDISQWASAVSAVPEVRAYLLDMQRGLADEKDVIMDGRDIGTVVLPDADLKIFLTASPEERARRRYLELLERGQQVEYENVLDDLKERDKRDSSRDVAPLKIADDAVLVDTTGNTFEQSLDLLLNLVRERLF